MPSNSELENLVSNTIRGLAMDAVQKANSGHPGMPMGMSDIATVVWGRYLVVDPDHPTWPNRDRFVLSNGHGSMLLYSLLHLCGFPMPMEQLKEFRQWGSHTAGHPEVDQALGIETTTGPLGQGFGTGVGMAIAEAHLRERHGADRYDHHTIGFVSDGDLMEGVSAEASSLAGHLGLGRLVYYYDDNEISIDGDTDHSFTENVPERFKAVGWHVLDIDGHDRDAVASATDEALAVEDKPSLVVCHTHIGYGAPNKQDTAAAHGSPLGEDEVILAKETLGLPTDKKFWVPDEVYKYFTDAMDRGRRAYTEWSDKNDVTETSTTPVTLDGPAYEVGEAIATRNVNQGIFTEIAEKLPGFLGGGADLVESTKTEIEGAYMTATDHTGRNIHYGVREHAMGTITNGLALHGDLRPYGATFFVFSDYMRPAVRLSALIGAPSIWVYTHDSIFLGEDGPTHQPVEHLASLRAMPNMWVIRPADVTEAVEAWEVALNRHDGPVALIHTRQGIPVLDRQRGGVAKGGYVLRDGTDVVIIATGSEVHVALGAADLLGEDGISARVVSLPCWEVFSEQDESYRESILGSGIPRVSLEAAATLGWERWVGADGLSIGIDHFGASAPYQRIAEEWGFTPANVKDVVNRFLKGES